MSRPPRPLAAVAFLVLVLAAWLFARLPTSAPPASPPAGAPEASVAPGPTVTQAYRDHRSGVEVEAAGRVARVLPDDRSGLRHQRFIFRVGGTSVLVAHNIDLATRVPLAVGDSIELRGEYEWNTRGGVIHWTHHDPDGRHEAGWVRLGGKLYH